jgi:hypothetical protein
MKSWAAVLRRGACGRDREGQAAELGRNESEIEAAHAGDDIIAGPVTTSTYAVTFDAAADTVWSWLVQMGQNRGGMYSYERLENLFGLDIHNTNQIHPEWQHLAQFVASPRDGTEGRKELKHLKRLCRVRTQTHRAGHCVGDIRDDAIAPAPHFVPEVPGAAQPGHANCAVTHFAIGFLVAPRRRDLDHEVVPTELHLECGMVEVTRLATLAEGRDRLESPATPAHAMGSAARS